MMMWALMWGLYLALLSGMLSLMVLVTVCLSCRPRCRRRRWCPRRSASVMIRCMVFSVSWCGCVLVTASSFASTGSVLRRGRL